ncbi:MAG: aldehyde dehydrogenase family protein, partial [Betaproteobacteria bacterium]
MGGNEAGLQEIGHHVGGAPLQGAQDRRAEVFNPATGEVIAQVRLADAAVVDAAVRAAQSAWPLWAETSALNR